MLGGAPDLVNTHRDWIRHAAVKRDDLRCTALSQTLPPRADMASSTVTLPEDSSSDDNLAFNNLHEASTTEDEVSRPRASPAPSSIVDVEEVGGEEAVGGLRGGSGSEGDVTLEGVILREGDVELSIDSKSEEDDLHQLGDPESEYGSSDHISPPDGSPFGGEANLNPPPDIEDTQEETMSGHADLAEVEGTMMRMGARSHAHSTPPISPISEQNDYLEPDSLEAHAHEGSEVDLIRQPEESSEDSDDGVGPLNESSSSEGPIGQMK